MTLRKLTLDLMLVAILAVGAGAWTYPKKTTELAYTVVGETEAVCAQLYDSLSNAVRRIAR